MELDLTYWQRNRPVGKALGVAALTECDARVFGGMMTVCEFAGNQTSPDEKRRCKFYEKSAQRPCCMYFREEFEGGHCDCGEPK